jgi:hypothetical protein
MSRPDEEEAGDDLAVYGQDDSTRPTSLSGSVPSVRLPDGQALNEQGADRLLRSRRATTIAIVGDRDSGKSTLVSALYDRLLRGPYAGYAFTGSRTLVALEKRLHDSRVDSGRDTPETVRTSRAEGLLHFHFGLAIAGDPASRYDLLLSDRAGEVYRDARASTDLIQTLTEISRADKIILLLDGHRLSDVLERTGATQAVRQTLRAFTDNGVLGLQSLVQVVTTKWDLLNTPDRTDAVEHLQTFENRLARDFRGLLGELSFWRVAARDPKGIVDPALGLDALLRNWAEPSAEVMPQLSALSIVSQFDKLLVRMAMERHQ